MRDPVRQLDIPKDAIRAEGRAESGGQDSQRWLDQQSTDEARNVLGSPSAVVHEEEVNIVGCEETSAPLTPPRLATASRRVVGRRTIVHEEGLVSTRHHMSCLLVGAVADLERSISGGRCAKPPTARSATRRKDGCTLGIAAWPLNRRRTRLSIPFGLRHDGSTPGRGCVSLSSNPSGRSPAHVRCQQRCPNPRLLHCHVRAPVGEGYSNSASRASLPTLSPRGTPAALTIATMGHEGPMPPLTFEPIALVAVEAFGVCVRTVSKSSEAEKPVESTEQRTHAS